MSSAGVFLSPLKRLFHWFLGLKTAVKVALLVIAGITLWMLSGILGSNDKVEESTLTSTSSKVIPSVQVEQFPREEAASTFTLFGRTEADDKVVIKSRITGEVERIFVKPGDLVKKGDLLMKFEENGHTDSFRSAEANVKKAEIAHRGRVRLKNKGLSSDMGSGFVCF